MKVVTFALLSGASALQADKFNPVKKVVGLVKGLQSSIIADGQEDQKFYDKNACWFETTMDAKKLVIKENEETLEKANEDIKKYEAQKASSKADLLQAQKDLAANAKAQQDAMDLRSNEKDEFDQNKADTEAALTAMNKALHTLSGAGTGFKQGLASGALVGIASTVSKALGVVGPDSIPVHQRSIMEDFVSDPVGFYQSSNFVNDYAPQSTNIQGILKSMYEEFGAALQKSTHDELIAIDNYNKYMATKATEKKALEKKERTLNSHHATATENLANTKTLRKETIELLTETKAFLAEVTESGKERAAEWAERTRLRTEELNGIAEAIRILEDPEMDKVFEKSGFLEVFMSEETHPGRQQAAFEMLKSASMETSSVRIAMLAAKVKMSGHFDAVISEIDKMIQLLRDEEAEDISDKDDCAQEATMNAARQKALGEEQAGLKSQITGLDNDNTELNTNVNDTQTAFNLENKTLADAIDTRNTENKAFIKHRKETQAVIALLGKAIGALAKFYKKNGIELSLIGKPKEYTVDTEKIPDGFGKGYGGRQGETRGLNGILSLILEDQRQSLAKGAKSEADAMAEFQAMRTTSLDTMATLEEKMRNLRGEIAENEETIAVLKGENLDSQGETSAVNGANNKLKKSCDWVHNNFKNRKDARATEMEALQNAKATLAGASAANIDFDAEHAFLQKTVNRHIQ